MFPFAPKTSAAAARGFAFFASSLGIACGTDAEVMRSVVEEVKVRFEYRAPTEIDPMIAAEHASCAQSVGFTHVHPSWRDYAVVRMQPEASELWAVTFSDVPVGGEKIRVSDANACPTHRTGAVTALLLYANGVLLTRAVDTPGEGIEPGFGFSVDEDGQVAP